VVAKPGSKNSTSPKVERAAWFRSRKGQIPSALSVFGAAVFLGHALLCECVERIFQERESALLFWVLGGVVDDAPRSRACFSFRAPHSSKSSPVQPAESEREHDAINLRK
jgi:hypothetical protein